MTVQDFLLQAAELKTAVQCKKERIQDLRLMKNYSKSMVGIYGKPSKNFRESKIDKIVCKISDMEQKLLDIIADYTEKVEQASNLIEKIKAAKRRTLMERHYLLGETWEKVAEEMDISLRSVHSLHKQTLITLEPLYRTTCCNENGQDAQQKE
jgi:predicted transcriptional regulator